MQRQGRKRLHVDIPEGLYKEFKLMAVACNVTMTKLICRLMVEKLKQFKGQV